MLKLWNLCAAANRLTVSTRTNSVNLKTLPNGKHPIPITLFHIQIMVVGILVYFVCKRRNGRPKHQPLSDKQVEDYEMENEAPESKMME